MPEHKSFSNGWLVVFVLFISLVFLSVIYRFMLQANPQKNWQELQKQNLAADLSGQTNAQTEHLKTGQLKGKYIRLPILMYHHIGVVPPGAEKDAIRQGLTVSPENFEEQVAWLKGQSYHSVSLQNLLDFSRGEFQMPKNPVIFTFDDGYDDAVINGSSILKKYGFAGSFAIITMFPGLTSGTNTYATWQQLKQAKGMGMEIVSHTQDHFDGSNHQKYDDGFMLRNLQGARQNLKDNLGIDTQILIYPFGHYDSLYLSFVKQAGYLMGITTKESKTITLDKFLEIPRLRVSNETTIAGFKKMMLE